MPGPDNPLYRNETESVLEIFKILNQGLQVISDLKLKRILGKSFKKPRGKRAPFRRSHMTLSVLTANLIALRNLFIDSGFSELLGRHEPGAEKSLLLDFNRLIDISQKIQKTVARALKNEGNINSCSICRLRLQFLENPSKGKLPKSPICR